MAGDTDQDNRWKRFQKISFDKKQTLKRIRKVEVTSMRHAHKFILKRWRNVRDVRRIVIFWIAAVGCLIAAAGLQLVWDRQSYQVEAGAIDSTYAEAAIGPIHTLNPLFADTPAEEAVSRLMFSRIFTYDSTGNLNYDLAKNVEVSENNLTYTVTLRHDVSWHDGRTLTADDVVFTAELLKDAATRAQIRGWDTIDVEKKDDFVVEFKLKAAYAPWTPRRMKRQFQTLKECLWLCHRKGRAGLNLRHIPISGAVLPTRWPELKRARSSLWRCAAVGGICRATALGLYSFCHGWG